MFVTFVANMNASATKRILQDLNRRHPVNVMGRRAPFVYLRNLLPSSLLAELCL